MSRRSSPRSGFTLVELLIVVIILGVLAAIAIPQFTSNTEDARISALDTNLSEMRNAVELYYHQHSATYPGANRYDNGAAVTTTAQADTSFLKQLTLYTAATGVTSTSKDATHKYGPYIKKAMPANPYNSSNEATCDITETDITQVAAAGTAGWKFYVKTGRLIANDGTHTDR
ncbi:MAG: prepilin-type N-terminal cleavage/methylation domain-containing protein [Candidatus Eisenbacteria sp.]|nr:prepilin-type N-terminal cleavage/methylation domain-containing protein [Candidatus Eisenbacteria bacterium]